MNCSRWSTSTPSNLSCVLPRLSPVGEDVPDDAVVPLADDDLEGALLSRVAAARAPASRARGKLDATSCDEGAEPQDLFVRRYAMGLPAAGRAHAFNEISDRTDVCGIVGKGTFVNIATVTVIQVPFERRKTESNSDLRTGSRPSS